LSERCTWTCEDEFWERTREEPEREGTEATAEKKEAEKRSKPREREIEGAPGLVLDDMPGLQVSTSYEYR
jgi:hypothetical protein